MAAQQKQNKRRNFSKRNYDKRNKRYRRNRPQYKCPICNRPIREFYTAITHKDSEVPAHFDCVLREIKKQEELSQNEKICYLGNGSFGVITFRTPNSPIKFLIRKRIQYETKDENPPWRKKLPVRLS
jgi:hypothetical protein